MAIKKKNLFLSILFLVFIGSLVGAYQYYTKKGFFATEILTENEVLTKTAYDFSIITLKNTPANKLITEMGDWHPGITKALMKFVTTGSTILHLGANIGFEDVLMGKLVSPDGAIYTFEPNPEVLGTLKKNILLNKLDSIVQVFPMATAAEKGISTLCFGEIDPNQEPPQKCHQIGLVKLDDLELPNMNFILMDIEGSEIDSLQGAQDLLKRSGYPPILMTWDPKMMVMKGASPKDFLYSAEDQGYMPHKIVLDSTTGWMLVPIKYEELRQTQSSQIVLFSKISADGPISLS
jgi:FkbM family methyltransferase